MQSRDTRGFTLIELLVVILIIAILAAVAIPVFLRQREKSYVSHVESALKNAATALESYMTETGGNALAANGADSDSPADAEYQVLVTNGYKKPDPVQVTVATDAGGTLYCVTAIHDNLPATHPWQRATYNSNEGSPEPTNADNCP